MTIPTIIAPTTTDNVEEWRPIAGYQGLYEVSSLGRVRSLDAEVINRPGPSGGTRSRRGRILRLKPQNGGYPIVILSKSSVLKTFTIHKLVALAFCEKPPGWAVDDQRWTINHKDFVKTNNVWTNLEWVTQSENLSHSGRAGRMIRANVTKLTEGDVRDIRRRCAAGELHQHIADVFGVKKNAIDKISCGMRWKHVQ